MEVECPVRHWRRTRLTGKLESSSAISCAKAVPTPCQGIETGSVIAADSTFRHSCEPSSALACEVPRQRYGASRQKRSLAVPVLPEHFASTHQEATRNHRQSAAQSHGINSS